MDVQTFGHTMLYISGEQLGQHMQVLVSGLVSGLCYTSIIKEEGTEDAKTQSALDPVRHI